MLTYAHIIVSALLIVAILLQQTGGGGLSSTFGGGMMEYNTKRGAEKIIFYSTIVLAVLFLGISVARLVL
jgi:protein translocase SecG subunit